MKKIFDKANLAYRIHSTFFKVAESLIAVITGGFIGASISEKSFSAITVLFTVLFLITQLLKFVLDRTVGESILNELWCANELEAQKQLSSRNLSNFQRITRSVRALNEATCSIESVCEQNFPVFVAPILKGFFENSNDLLCTKDAKIYLLLFCNWIGDIKDGKLTQEPDFQLVFRDDFGNLDTDEDFLRERQSVLGRAVTSNKFTQYRTQYTGKIDTIIGCPIPTVCEDGGTLGCIVVAANLKSSDCCNLEEVMSIYTRILSNAIAKYNNCVTNRYDQQTAKAEQKI
jgi:hypothetical protein